MTFRNIVFDWKTCFKNKSFTVGFIFFVIALSILLAIVPQYLAFVESRQGELIADPILELLPATDFSWQIFTLIYLASISSLAYILPRPKLFGYIGLGYILMTCLRMLAIYLSNLEAPLDIVFLHDPLADKIIYGGKPLTKDLFFSGHTSTLYLFYLAIRLRWLRWATLVACIGVAVMIVWQHAHYSYDVIAAPIFAWFSYRVGKWFSEQYIWHEKI